MKNLRAIFEKQHTHNGLIDQDQVSVIFNQSKRLIIEAPAGYGKTKTMVSRIAYLIISDQLASTKKILTLTFSVNAAYKIRREVLDQVKELFEDKAATRLISQRVEASNYHGFCRQVLKMYGYLLHPNLKNINEFRIVDETKDNELNDLPLDNCDKEFLKSYSSSLKSIGKPNINTIQIEKYLEENRTHYIDLLIKKFVPSYQFTYNGILLIVIHLFACFPQVSAFYKEYFPIIFVDEFQDTNWLQWMVLQLFVGQNLISSKRRHLYLFGDRVQRIYGFIGAIPDIFDRAKTTFDMDIIKLSTNHRFDINSKLGKIDYVLRANAENLRMVEAPITVIVPIFENSSQIEIGGNVIRYAQELLANQPDRKVAIVVRNGLSNTTTKEIYNALRVAGLDFFFALFNEDDREYIAFHKNCFDIWLKGLQIGTFRSFKNAQKYVIDEIARLPSSEVNSSLSILLKLLMGKVQQDYSFLTFEEKSEIILDTLANRGLKQHLDLVKSSKVVLVTAHGSKGLEWDYVIMPDLNKFCFPPAPFCINQRCNNCIIDWSNRSIQFEQAFLEELSVFYVAVTRAKEDVIFMFSNSVTFNKGGISAAPLSCLAQLPGIIPEISKLP